MVVSKVIAIQMVLTNLSPNTLLGRNNLLLYMRSVRSMVR